MANIKTITKKLINNGYSENKLMMMTEKEIREAYKTLKEDSSMNKTIKVRRDSHESFESWIDRINKLLSSNGIHLDNNKLLTIVDDEETDCVSIEDGLINVYGWCAGEPYYCYYDFHGNLKQYSNEGTNFELVEVEKEETTMKDNNTTVTNNSTNNKEETIMRELMNNTINRIETATKVQDAEYVTRDELAGIMEQLTGVRPGKKVTRKQMVQDLYILEDDLQQIENAEMNSNSNVSVGDLDITNDNAPESIEEPTPVVKNPTPVSDARAKTNELLNLIHEHAKDNKRKGYGTTISSHMLQAYILKVGHNVPKLKGHTVTKDEYETTIRVYKWLLDNGYIKPCAYSVNEDSNIRVYIADYNGKTGNVGHGITYLPYNATNAVKYTVKKAVLFAVK